MPKTIQPKAPSQNKPNKQIIGNAGMYYVCYLLSQKGWNAMPTARNAKGIDIVAYSEDGNFLGIQVKTISKLTNISLGSCTGGFLFDFLFVVVLSDTISESDNPSIYILSKEDVMGITRQYGNSFYVRQDLYTKNDSCYKNNWSKLD